MIAFYSLAAFGLSIYLFRKASGGLSLKRLNIVTILFYIILIFHYIGSFLLVTEVVDYRLFMIRSISDPYTAITKAHVAVLSCMVLLPLFILMFSKIFNVNLTKEIDRIYRTPLKSINQTGDKKIFPFLCLIVGLIVLGLAYLIASVKTIPIFEVIQGAESQTIKQARISSIEGNFLLKLINGIIGNWIAPIITLVIFGYYKIEKNYKYKLLFYISASVTIFILIFKTEKAPIIQFLILILIINGIFKGGVDFKKYIKWGIVGLMLLIVQYVFFMGTEDVLLSLLAIINRLFFAQHMATVLAFDYFPSIENYLGGKLFLPFSSFIFGYDAVRSFALRIMEHYLPYAWESGTVGYMSSLFIAEGYANWGYVGIPLSIFIVSFFITMICFVQIRSKLHPVTLALIVFLMLRIPFSLNSGLRIAIYSPELILTALTLLSIIFFSRGKAVIRFKRKQRKSKISISSL